MYTTFLLYYSSSKFSKFIQGKSPVLQQLASVSFLKEKSKICPKLIELLSWNGPTVHVCCFVLARASTKTFVSRIHIRQRSPKKPRKKSSLAEKFVSRVTRQPRYHCVYIIFIQSQMVARQGRNMLLIVKQNLELVNVGVFISLIKKKQIRFV